MKASIFGTARPLVQGRLCRGFALDAWCVHKDHNIYVVVRGSLFCVRACFLKRVPLSLGLGKYAVKLEVGLETVGERRVEDYDAPAMKVVQLFAQ